MRAYFAGLEFVGDGGAATFTLGRNGLVGWFEGVGTRGEQTARSVADGDHVSPAFLTGRLITLTGLVLGASTEAALSALSALPRRTLGQFAVESDDSDTWALVRRLDKPDISVDAWGSAVSYQLRLYAPDPFRYGEEVISSSGTEVSIAHAGNTVAVPVIEVSGSMPSGYEIASQGKRYVVTQALTSGHTHVIDMANGFLTLDGDLQVGAVSRCETFTIPRGAGATVTITPVSGSGSIVVHTVDTWE
ncbi:hypothetical protein [Microbacterium jejuense]|uniref:hypothetical protein n=1 Tax=Microbacterium jejuense TaxID=1263637 RepID=UPI0031E67198